MNRISATQLMKSAIWALTYVFTLCVIITGIIVVSRIGEFIGSERTRTVIELNSKEAEIVAPAAPSAPSQNRQEEIAALLGDPNFGFQASDSLGVWEQEQQVEIFKIKYDEKGNVSVDGAGDKVIAPGTSNVYNFTFKNTGDVGLKYTLTTEVEFSDPEYAPPVSVRLYDQTDRYLIGSKTSFDDPLKMNVVSDTAGLSPKSYANYAFEWQWPFESGNDEYDTMLGNMAVDKDITMTVRILVRAEGDADAMGGNPSTGDDSNLSLYVTLCVLSMIGVIVMLVVLRKKKEEGGAENE